MLDAPEEFDPFSPRFRRWQRRIDATIEPIAARLGMCGHGAPLNWWVRVAELLFVDCPCCLVWRGIAVGAVLGIGITAAIAALIHSI